MIRRPQPRQHAAYAYTPEQLDAIAAAQGAAADITLAFDASNAAQAALQAEYDAYRAAHPDDGPPSDGGALLVGVTKDGTHRAAWDVIRTYNTADALKVPAGMVIATSFSSFTRPGWRDDSTIVARIADELGRLPDQPGVRVDHMHEPEDDYGHANGHSNYLADGLRFANLVADANAPRVHPLIVNRCFMGANLGKHSKCDLTLWAANPGDYDELGIDVYAYGQIDLSVDFAARVGKPLCIPEMGPLSNVPHEDEPITDYMATGIAAYRAAEATWVSWFDKAGSGADLDQYPHGCDYWGSQTTAALAVA